MEQHEREQARYVVGKHPNRLVTHNQETWDKLMEALGKGKPVAYDRLVFLARDHQSGNASQPHPFQFINYCIDNDWLKVAE